MGIDLVGGETNQLDIAFLELRNKFSERPKLGGAAELGGQGYLEQCSQEGTLHWSEVGRVREEDNPRIADEPVDLSVSWVT